MGSLDAIINFLNNDKNYKPFCDTVVGFGGTRKSFIIIIFISIVLYTTQCNDTVKAVIPSGEQIST